MSPKLVLLDTASAQCGAVMMLNLRPAVIASRIETPRNELSAWRDWIARNGQESLAHGDGPMR